MDFFDAFVANLGTKAGALLAGTIFASGGWLVTYSVESVVSVPTVEYNIDFSRNGSGFVAVTVRNLSEDHKFSDLAFILRLPRDGSGLFMEAAVEPIPPAYSPQERLNLQDLAVSYRAIGLHPGTSVKLTANYSGQINPTFHIEPSGEGVRLLRRGWKSWIISNEIEALLGLFVAWAVMVIFALGKAKGRGGNGN